MNCLFIAQTTMLYILPGFKRIGHFCQKHMDTYSALYNCHLIEIFREKLLRITGENLHYCWINKVLVLMHFERIQRCWTVLCWCYYFTTFLRNLLLLVVSLKYLLLWIFNTLMGNAGSFRRFFILRKLPKLKHCLFMEHLDHF